VQSAVFGDPTYADAIMDRLVHSAYRIEMKGESMRRRAARTTGEAVGKKQKSNE